MPVSITVMLEGRGVASGPGGSAKGVGTLPIVTSSSVNVLPKPNSLVNIARVMRLTLPPSFALNGP
jgi:hypothetical protein